MTGREFREVGHRLVDDIAGFLDSIRERPVTRGVRPSGVREMLPRGPVPEEGSDAGALLRATAPLLFDHSLHNGHPRFFGYITSSAAPIGALCDMLAAAINPNLGGWELSPVASEIEIQSVRWIGELIGYGEDCGGILVSGGNMANFAAFLAARRAKAPATIRDTGMGGDGAKLRVYATAETHTWIHKAMDLFGHGTEALRVVPMDDRLCADAGALRRMVEEDRADGKLPFLAIATTGTTGTGAIDPVREMAAVCKEHDLWFHVDGAYGAPAAILPDAPDDLRAIRQADSVAIDPHKWFYTPLEAGCVLVRDPATLPAAFSHTPSYYHFDDDEQAETNFYEYGMQNSRGFRALKVWLSLRQVGRRGFERMIGDDIRLTDAMFRLFDDHPELEAVTLSLSIATFRYVPPGIDPGDPQAQEYLDELNDALLGRLKREGEAYLSNAIVGGRFLLRACIVNFRTSLEDVEALPEIVAGIGRDLDREMRPPKLG
jgi:glutamate/tyrosine decarboxylase-like PLP-dependent enzyme